MKKRPQNAGFRTPRPALASLRSIPPCASPLSLQTGISPLRGRNGLRSSRCVDRVRASAIHRGLQRIHIPPALLSCSPAALRACARHMHACAAPFGRGRPHIPPATPVAPRPLPRPIPSATAPLLAPHPHPPKLASLKHGGFGVGLRRSAYAPGGAVRGRGEQAKLGGCGSGETALRL